MERTLNLSKDELLHRLGRYDVDEVQGTFARISGAIGDTNQGSFDVEQHVLWVTLRVVATRELQRRRTQELKPAAELVAKRNDALWLIDEDECIVAVSKAGAAALGYEPKELAGRSNKQLRAEGQDWRQLREEAEQDGYKKGVTMAQAKDGTPVPVAYETHAVPIAGRLMFLVATEALAHHGELTYEQLAKNYASYADLKAGRRRRASRVLENDQIGHIAAAGIYGCWACKMLGLLEAIPVA